MLRESFSRGPRRLGKSFSRVMHQARKGVGSAEFKRIQSGSPFTEAEWSHFLDLAPRTLQRYKRSKKTFDTVSSEKIGLIAQVLEKGRTVFGDNEMFVLWLGTPSIALAGAKPAELFDTFTGVQLVADELGRLEYGVFA